MSKVILTWTPPAARTNGDALTLADFASFSVFRGAARIGSVVPAASMTFEDDGVSGTDVYTVKAELNDGTSSTASVTPTPVANPNPVTDLKGTFFA